MTPSSKPVKNAALRAGFASIKSRKGRKRMKECNNELLSSLPQHQIGIQPRRKAPPQYIYVESDDNIPTKEEDDGIQQHISREPAPVLARKENPPLSIYIGSDNEWESMVQDQVVLESATVPNVAASNEGPLHPRYLGDEDEGMSTKDDYDANNNLKPVTYQDSEAMMKALRRISKSENRVFFHGNYNVAIDPLITEKEHVQTTTHDLWKATGYQFRVKENKELSARHKTQYWCCQDKARKQKSRPSKKEGVKHHDMLGMMRYDCKSSLRITCCQSSTETHTITVWLEHHQKHVPYYDVSLPAEAAAMVRENLEWTSPREMVRKVQAAFPAVSAKQVHFAWTMMSETLWRRDKAQLPSVKALLTEYKDNIDVFDLPTPEGVEQMAWGMKKIVGCLRGKIVEIGVDATYNTNLKHLELYTVLGEYDNAGFPLSYCLLPTASSVEEGKRTKALETWASTL